MEDNNQNNVQQTQENNNQIQDARMIHPEIIGELRKNKIGKPVMVIELFLLFGIVFAGLPFINSQLNDENSKLYQIIHGKSPSIIIQNTTSVNDEYLDGSKNSIISNDIKLRYKNIIMSNISLYKNDNNSGMKCLLSSYNGEINLDEQDVYFELSNAAGTRLVSFKLTGTIDRAEQEYEFSSSKFQYNENVGYQGKIVFMTDDDYPEIDLKNYSLDSNGMSVFECKKDYRTIKYQFKNNYLIRIDDRVLVDNSDTNYLNYKKEYEEKVEQLGNILSDVEETNDGLLFRASIDLSGDYKIKVVDYDYYPSNTLAKKIAYAQTSKGYDCK